MEDYTLTLKKLAKFAKEAANEEETGHQPEPEGGTLRNGEYGWLAYGSYLEIIQLDTGFKVSRFDFSTQFGSNAYAQISTVVDLELPDFSTPILAIGFRTDSSESGFVCIFSVQSSRPLQILQFPDCVSVLQPLLTIPEDVLYSGFDGCLIVGFDSGRTAFIDLDLRDLQHKLIQAPRRENCCDPVPCVTIPSDASEEEIGKCHKEAYRQKCGFGLDLKVLEDAGPVLSLLPLPQLRTLAVGLCDGRLVLYHLDNNMEAFHLALPPEPMSPLVCLAFMEPADDPKPCVYLWAFHETPEMAIAVMHSVVFEDRRVVANRETVYQGFQSCRVRLTMPIQDKGSVPLACHAICKSLSAEESLTCVCLLAWKTERKTSMLMVFDLNQWYKEQMPWVGNWREMPKYVSVFPLNEDPLSIRMDERSLSWFNSLDRPEEHFYPTAMAFDCLLLSYKASARYHWPGLQNRALNMLEYCGPNAILEPDMCYRAMLNATLVPQFSEENYKLDSMLSKKRELLLSIALEYNCVGLLKRCARVWADGSHMGRDPNRGLSLATLTDWIWSRSLTIKQYCNTMCVPLFDYSGRQLGTAEQKRLSHCGVQLKWLAEIMDMIMTTCNQYIPEDILEQLKEQQESIQIAAEYQEILVWMFNMGLLPECNGTSTAAVSMESASAADRPAPMVYPYELLNNFYRQRREQLFEVDRKYVRHSATWTSCSMLYIDALIDKECGGVALYRDWKEDGGTGLYPPRSLQSMLRVLLLPNVSIQSKYTIFMYLFMDLNVVYHGHECHGLVLSLYKFPMAFKMNKDLIKMIESFWHLDHNNFDEVVADLKTSIMTKWQLELMVECLFVHQYPQLSLRALQMPGPSISPVIEMRVLLGNNLISEAFLFQKKHGDKTLLMEFFNSCYRLGSLRAILKLPLTETEGQLLGEFLLSVDSSMPRNLHFVYLLQKSKYVEAVDLVENLRLRKSSQVDTGSVAAVLTTYKSTMPPMYQEMSEVYKRSGMKGLNHSVGGSTMEGSSRSPMATPLSSQLIRNKVDVNSSVYQMAITAVKEATNYSLFQGSQAKSPNKFTSIPFLRKPLQENMYEHEASVIIYPKIVEGQSKRNLNESEREDGFAKRRKLDDINTGLLTSFQPSRSAKLEFNQSLRNPSANSLLATPIVKRVMNSSSNSNLSPAALAKLTPHSILKARNVFRESPVPDEKILRFKPSVSPSIFDISEIQKPEARRSTSAGYEGPKPRRSLRSITPEANILSSTRNPIDAEEVRANSLENLEEEMRAKISEVEKEEEVGRMTRSKSKDVSPTKRATESPRRELRSRSRERSVEPQSAEDKKPVEVTPRRSLRSRTPEPLSPRRTATTTTTTSVTKSTTKKTLTRIVLESNAKKNLMELEKAGGGMADIPEAVGEERPGNSTLDSTLPMSDYSWNVSEMDPMVGERTILTDNSCVTDSMLGEWRERQMKAAARAPGRESFVSDNSELPSLRDNLDYSTTNPSFCFVAPENKSLEEDSKLVDAEDHLKEDTVYEPEEREERQEERDEEEGYSEDVERREERLETEEELNTPAEIPTLELPPVNLPQLVNQDTFVVQETVSKFPPKPVTGEDENSSPSSNSDDSSEFDENDFNRWKATNKSASSDNSDEKVEEDFRDEEDANAEEEDGGGDLDDVEGEGDAAEEDSYSDDFDDETDGEISSDDGEDEEEQEAKQKPFKTNEVIDLLDSSDEDVRAVEVEVKEEKQDEEEEEEKVKESPPVEIQENRPSNSAFNHPTFAIAPPLVSESFLAADPLVESPNKLNQSVESPQFEAIATREDSPEAMEAEEEVGDIYEDMEVDVVGEEDDDDGGLNDALMIDEESKESVGLCLRVDEDSKPEGMVDLLPKTVEIPPPVTEEQSHLEGTFAGDSSVNPLEKAFVMDDLVAEGEADIYAGLEEVNEVVPPPKVAYQTTDRDEEQRETEKVEMVGGEEEKTAEDQVVEGENIGETNEKPGEGSSEEIPPILDDNGNPAMGLVGTPDEQPEREINIPENVEEEKTETIQAEEPQPNAQLEDPLSSEPITEVPDKIPEVPEPKSEDPIEKDLPQNPTSDFTSEIPQEEPESSPQATETEAIAIDQPMPPQPPQQDLPTPPVGSEPDQQTPEPESSSQPEKITLRRRSLRAVSQPHTATPEASKIRTRRVSAAAEEAAASTPKRERRNSNLLDPVEEQRGTPNLRLTPMRLARMNESTENLSTTPVRRSSRGVSLERELTRATRGRSKVEDDDDNQSVASNTSRRSLRSRRGAGDTDADDAKSTVSTSSTTTQAKRAAAAARAKKTLMDTTIPEEPEDYSSSRRLTRHQQQIMERSMQLQQKAALDLSGGSTISPGTPPVVEESAAESDADSMSSKISRASQQRRSVRARSEKSDISESGGSTRSTRSSRMKPPTGSSNAAKKKLSAIIEAEGSRPENQDEDPSAAGDSSRKRGRSQK